MNATNQEATSPQSPAPNSSWLKTFSIGFSIISFGITLAIVGYFILTAKQNQPTNQQPITTSPTISAVSPAPNGVGANWKTYTSIYGFTFRYPSTWKLKTQKIDEGVEHDLKPDYEALLSYDEPNQPPHGGFSYGTILTILKPKENKNNLNARQWAGEIASWEKIENLTVQGIESVRVIEEIDGLTQTVYIPYKGMVYQITSWSFATTDTYEKEFDQILSTFQFSN